MNYKKYIQSKKWNKKSKEIILIVGKCERCGSGHQLTCHHKHYKTLGFERRKDLMVLCWDCHKQHHQVKKQRIKTFKLQKQLSQAKENYKEYIKDTLKINQMRTEFLRKGKIKGFSKTKSKKIIAFLLK